MTKLLVMKSSDLSRYYLKYSANIKYFVISILRSNFESDDIVSKCFIELSKKELCDFDTEASLKNFLFVLARNACKNIIKRRKIDKAVISSISFTSESSYEEIIESRLTKSFLIEQVTSLIHSLSNLQKRCLILVYNDGLSAVEASSILGISPDTVRVHISRALNRIRKCVNSNTKDVQLNEQAQNVLDLVKDGQTVSEAATILGMSHVKAYNILRRIKSNK